MMRFGLVGVGAIGAVRAAALERNANAELVATHDLDQARALSVAPNARFFSNVHEMIQSADVDAIIVSTPPPSHEELAIAAVAAGKHVLVEKPMAASVEACEAMVKAARSANRLLTVGYNQRYFEAVKLMRDVVQSGELGRLSHVRAYAGHTGLSEFKAPWMYDADVMGGGTLMDNGTHIVDLVRYVMGDATEVYGHAADRVWGLGAVEDNALALIRSKEGVTASIQASWSEWKGYRFHIEAYGERGMARAYYAPMMATIIRLDKPGGARRVERHFYPGSAIREKLKGWQTTAVATFVEELDDFVATAQGHPSSGRLALAEDGLRAVQIAQAVYESSRSSKSIFLPSLS